jgi:hypothetical protein
MRPRSRRMGRAGRRICEFPDRIRSGMRTSNIERPTSNIEVNALALNLLFDVRILLFRPRIHIRQN